MFIPSNCKISRKVSFERFKYVTEKYNRIPNNLLEFHNLKITNNHLIQTLIEHIPFLHLDACYQIRNNWYKFQLCFTNGNIMRFAQLDVTSPLDGEQRIKNIRYIDLQMN